MPRKKDYVSHISFAYDRASATPVDPVAELALRSGRFDLRELLGPTGRITGNRFVDLSGWKGRGIDRWVDQSLLALITLVRSGKYASATIVNSGYTLKNWFFEFIVNASQTPLCASPADLRPLHLTRYVEWLKSRQVNDQTSLESARHGWTQLKLVLNQLIEMGEIAIPGNMLFPKVYLRNGNGRAKTTGLSDSEVDRVAAALRLEITSHHHGRSMLNESDVATVRFLLIALRTGAGFTDLIELERDCLRPGIVPRVMRLVRKKVRAQKDIVSGVRGDPVEIDVGGIPLDSVGIIRMILRDTEQLAREVPPHIASRLWLFRSQEPQRRGLATVLSQSVVNQNTTKFVSRNNLLSDNGSPLVINASRFRKTMSLKALRASNGNLFTVASVLGNSPQIAGTHYMSITDDIKRAAANFMNTEFVAFVQGRNIDIVPIKVVEVGEKLDKTMVASCEDSLHGSFAPKDGTNRCEKFYMCLSCPSFAIVGDVTDLWRLFSFQEFLRGEIEQDVAEGSKIGGTAEALSDQHEYLASLVTFIDDFVGRNFPKGLITKARKKTETLLHPFWRQRVERRLLQTRKSQSGG